MKTRKRKLTQAQIGELYRLMIQPQNVRIVRCTLEGRMFRAEAGIPFRDQMPIDYIKARVADKLLETVMENGLIEWDVADDFQNYMEPKILRGRLTVMVPKG